MTKNEEQRIGVNSRSFSSGVLCSYQHGQNSDQRIEVRQPRDISTCLLLWTLLWTLRGDSSHGI